MTEVVTKDMVRSNLRHLIEQTGLKVSEDDVFRQFCASKEKRSNRKLLKILELLSSNQPHAKEYLAEAAQLLEKKEPLYCLMHFLNLYADTDKTMETLRQKDLPTSTPLLKKPADTVTAETVSEIRERVQQAAASCSYTRGISTINLNSAIASPPNLVATNASAITNYLAAEKCNTIDTNWYLNAADTYHCRPNNVAAIPASSQENMLMIELVYCLTGIRGSLVIPENVKQFNELHTGNSTGIGIKFKISEQVCSTLRDIAQEMMPLMSHFICVHHFTYKAGLSDCGQVLKALSTSLRKLMKDYFILLNQLEEQIIKGNMTLHKMIYYLRPTDGTMEVLAGTIKDIVQNELYGGQALTLLYNKIHCLIGDDDPRQFLITITQDAAAPYMEILQLWIQKGVIVDPQQEFLVEDNEHMRGEEVTEHYSADYWEKRYTIRQERIPCFLEKVSDIILNTGKYLNVIRQCGKRVTAPPTICLKFSPTSQDHITVIQNAYRFASKTLLEVLLQENDLMGHLMSVKRYLLLNQGDFITQFMDACEDELMKNVDKVLPMTLENLLGLTLRLSSAKNDPYKDDVHCELLTYDLVTQMAKIMMKDEEEYWQAHDRFDLTGIECFAFRYEVKWPVSLVLNHIAITKYQMLFRQLFYCKHVERQLCKVWKENCVAKKFSPKVAELYRSAFTLRQRMMNAIQNIEYYMMIEVIEPNWHIFIQNMSKVENIDDVLRCHQDFLDSCLKNCMLTDTTVLNRQIFKLCNLSLKFCEFIQNSQRFFLDAELTSMMCESGDHRNESEQDYTSRVQSESSLAPNETFSERVNRFELEFTAILMGLLAQINDIASDNPSERFVNLVHRINFNSFYSEDFGKLCANQNANADRK